jgi:hypothetical protein
LSDDHRGFAAGALLYRLGHYNAFLMNGLIRTVPARTELKPDVKAFAPRAHQRSIGKSYLNLVSSSSANGTKNTAANASTPPSVLQDARGLSTRESRPLADNEMIDVALRHNVCSDPLSGLRPTGCSTSPEEGEASDASPSESSFRSCGASLRSPPRRVTGTHNE